jgi:hypothetical protein
MKNLLLFIYFKFINIIKNILFNIFIWYLWKDFNKSMKSVTGFNSLDTLNNAINQLEQLIRSDNGIPIDQKITWDNSSRTDREQCFRYTVYKMFSENGELLKDAKNLRLTNG